MPCQYYCVGADGVGFGVGMINTGVHMYAVDRDDETTKHRHVVLHVATSLGPARDRHADAPIYPQAPAYARRARAARRRTGWQCWTT